MAKLFNRNSESNADSITGTTAENTTESTDNIFAEKKAKKLEADKAWKERKVASQKLLADNIDRIPEDLRDAVKFLSGTAKRASGFGTSKLIEFLKESPRTPGEIFNAFGYGRLEMRLKIKAYEKKGITVVFDGSVYSLKA